MNRISIIGAGLAGCEASWQAAQRGVGVDLYEMRPYKMTPAHKTGCFAELVCSNSLRASAVENAVGLLKEEMFRLDSLIMEAAYATKVPAGGALAVDRELFSSYISEKIVNHPLIDIHYEEVKKIPSDLTVIAAGPLVSDDLSNAIAAFTGHQHLFFHDAVAPVVAKDSIDLNIAFRASRYNKGDSAGDYLNCPMTESQYRCFYEELLTAELYPLHGFEEEKIFEGCMPIEAMAKRGPETMRYGPLKPVGLRCPDGSQPYAVVQLRQDNQAATMYNIVGFQTRLKQAEQDRVFRLIPGLEQAEFMRYGMMHLNTYINAPQILKADLVTKKRTDLLFAGQISGVEGYVESAASGLVAGINAARLALGRNTLILPQETAIGSLLRYISSPNTNFQPMNVTFGLLPPLEKRIRNKKEKNAAIAHRALAVLEDFLQIKS
ncbi:MAG: methylenetetrahydrofolate--tRNA-(uracil(54)-C(5))-methyltransferase (FADH(2)-oxidizing) TrmFO [Bacillota bacterium]|jgi:methylenetetrahydrofolate--tRNA-(uracil-5-)-methyltransferase